MNWEVVIGLEVHVQLSTQSKIFSAASTAFGATPNAQACAVDIALPGVLPVLNRGAVERALQFGLAIDAQINQTNVFARKNYFYPDLPKGYQISQYEQPIVERGQLSIRLGEQEKVVRITRAHLEEDAGKSVHDQFPGQSGIDLNRAGTPLLEVVSEPDMRSAAEAVAYAQTLHTLVVWLGICDGNMQEGSFRVDANVSVRRSGAPLGTRREIKNLNSFRFLQQAIEYETQWQIDELEDGRPIRQATVLFDPDTGKTAMMRSKEDAHDYRYFPDPDLLPVVVGDAWLAQVRAALPELPEALRTRFVDTYGLTPYDANLLSSSRALAAYFEDAVRAANGAAKPVANWINGELLAALNRDAVDIRACALPAEQLGAMVARIQDGTLSGKLAKEVFAALWAGEGSSVDALIDAKGLRQISDSSAIAALIDQVLIEHVAMVNEYRSGKEKAFNALVGQCMKATKGKANPQQVNQLLKEKLDAPA